MAELEHFRTSVIQELTDLPSDIKKQIAKSSIKVDEIVRNFDIFRNCLLFETKHSMPHPLFSATREASFVTFSSGMQKRLKARKMREKYVKGYATPPQAIGSNALILEIIGVTDTIFSVRSLSSVFSWC